MMFQNSAVDEEIVYQNKVTITISMENGQPVANPEVVYLNNGGEIDWVMGSGVTQACEIQFRTTNDEICPFEFDNSLPCTPTAPGCFSFAAQGTYTCFANRQNPTQAEEIWEYDIIIGGNVKDPVIRLKNTPEGG